MTAQPVDREPAQGLRQVFRRHASAVAAVTARAGVEGEPAGLLVTSLTSVSADPPLISFNVARTASSWPTVAEARHLGVHILEAGQIDLAQRFSTSGAERFGPLTDWEPGPFGVPLLEGVAAWAVAEVREYVPAGDHVIVIARLLHAEAVPGLAPLVHHDGGFHHLTAVPVKAHLSVVPTREEI
jgi:flavin reductase (DIM6/NTAB) family NADH-FMN oxidoreductase RutF